MVCEYCMTADAEPNFTKCERCLFREASPEVRWLKEKLMEMKTAQMYLLQHDAHDPAKCAVCGGQNC